MQFHSLEFIVFFALVVMVYFNIPHRFRWLWLLCASCYFYAVFIPVYILVLFLIIAIDYRAAILIEKSSGWRRKAYLIASIFSTCLVLFIFKYFNFFNVNLTALARFLHWNYPTKSLALILPIGLSFHTFQSLSYVIEVYHGHQKVQRHFGIYALYVMFFPQLVAGPIERPFNLLPQLCKEQEFDYKRATNGLRLMTWGFLKKIVIADRLALLVDHIYNNPRGYSGVALILATVFFSYQIYCDFSGYTDIARGAARVLGIELMENFRRPYFATSVREFWQRWHISLSSWFRDYLYIPLGGNRVSNGRLYMNVLIVFVLSGLWHGANWTFVLWGLLHGFYIVVSRITQTFRERFVRVIGLAGHPQLYENFKIATTFSLVCFAWIFFRANSLSDSVYITTHLFDFSQMGDLINTIQIKMGTERLLGLSKLNIFYSIVLIFFLEIVQRVQEMANVNVLFSQQPVMARWAVYYATVMVILFLGCYGSSQFIYFQF